MTRGGRSPLGGEGNVGHSDDDFGGGGETHCRGAMAVALGIGHVAAGGWLHFPFFWSRRERFLGFSQIGKIVSIIALAGAVTYFIFGFWFD